MRCIVPEDDLLARHVGVAVQAAVALEAVDVANIVIAFVLFVLIIVLLVISVVTAAAVFIVIVVVIVILQEARNAIERDIAQGASILVERVRIANIVQLLLFLRQHWCRRRCHRRPGLLVGGDGSDRRGGGGHCGSAVLRLRQAERRVELAEQQREEVLAQRLVGLAVLEARDDAPTGHHVTRRRLGGVRGIGRGDRRAGELELRGHDAVGEAAVRARHQHRLVGLEVVRRREDNQQQVALGGRHTDGTLATRLSVRSE